MPHTSQRSALIDSAGIVKDISFDKNKKNENAVGAVTVTVTVTDGSSPNIHQEPDKESNVVAVVICFDKLQINIAASTVDRYAVSTIIGSGVLGVKKS